MQTMQMLRIYALLGNKEYNRLSKLVREKNLGAISHEVEYYADLSLRKPYLGEVSDILFNQYRHILTHC